MKVWSEIRHVANHVAGSPTRNRPQTSKHVAKAPGDHNNVENKDGMALLCVLSHDTNGKLYGSSHGRRAVNHGYIAPMANVLGLAVLVLNGAASFISSTAP